MRHLVISVLISWDQELSENIWFVWPKTSYSGDVTMRDGRTNEQRQGKIVLLGSWSVNCWVSQLNFALWNLDFCWDSVALSSWLVDNWLKLNWTSLQRLGRCGNWVSYAANKFGPNLPFTESNSNCNEYFYPRNRLILWWLCETGLPRCIAVLSVSCVAIYEAGVKWSLDPDSAATCLA